MSEEEEIVKTSILIPRKLWREVKHYAIDKHLTLTEVIQTALREYLQREKEKTVK
jgi:metal-responsive CopG/Arc/MetJ family transcriptional regulator